MNFAHGRVLLATAQQLHEALLCSLVEALLAVISSWVHKTVFFDLQNVKWKYGSSSRTP